MNFLFAVGALFIRKILFTQKPSYQLLLVKLLFLSCIFSPIAIHFVNLPQKSILNRIAPINVISESSYHLIQKKIHEGINEVTILISPKPNIDLAYVYLVMSILFISGSLYRTCKIYRDILITKSIIDSAQPYKKHGKITIKISDQCVVPFSISFIKTAYIILPISILHSSINTKLAILHEGQHHRQGDCLWAYLIELTRIIFWFNPAINYWHKNFQELQELACDEMLVSKNRVSAYDYGSCLFHLTQAASQYLNAHHHACTVHMISKHKNETSLITRRICMLSTYKNERLSKIMLGAVIGISFISIIGPLGTAYATKGFISKNQNIGFDSINTLFIDPKIQNIAIKEISTAVTNSHAKSGAIVIADARTGKIVAFAEAGKSNQSWSSRIFNPASTIKPFIAAAAIDTGVASASTIVDCHSPYQIDGKQFKNVDSNIGNLSLSDAMTNSVNTCMIKLAQETGSSKTRQILSRFGFDMNAAWDKNNSDALNLANATMGSSIPVTLKTLTNAYITLANEGHFIRSDSENVVSEETANTVTRLLEKAVSNGTGKHAAMTNVLVAGKTGTLSNATYTSTLALFAGYVPSHMPRYVSIVVIENAQVNGSLPKANGGNIAAPVFRKALEQSLTISK
ncbi:MAG: cell division protein FtsI [Gammaproteobacteria bacterium]|nr:cell division protein FtsI [Gammaproteobacteria bacterium]